MDVLQDLFQFSVNHLDVLKHIHRRKHQLILSVCDAYHTFIREILLFLVLNELELLLPALATLIQYPKYQAFVVESECILIGSG